MGKARRKNVKTALNTYNPTNLLMYLRVYYGLTQTALAKATGLKVNDISRFEQGHPNMWFGKLKALADYFGISCDALYHNDFVSIGPLLHKPVEKERTLPERIRAHKEVCDRIGESGELWVTQQERMRLRGTIYENAVNPNYADDEKAHFDLMTFDPDTGENIIVEVKTTVGDANEAFIMTEHEWALMLYCQENHMRYELHRVHHIETPELRGRVIYTPHDIMELFDVMPRANVVVHDDGNVSWGNCSTVPKRYTFDVHGASFYVYGYETLAELFNDCVLTRVDNYTYSSSIKQ